jgi:5S rRNA maturation endonuclease (ribonuclease M5)
VLNNDEDKLNTLAQLCAERIDDLLADLDVSLYLSGNKYVGCCPIHGDSDNPAAVNIYYEGHSVPGYWKCRTKGCEKKFGKNIIGFARGCLSARESNYHWEKRPRAIFDFKKTLEYLCNFLNVDLKDIESDPKAQERRKFMAECVQIQQAKLTQTDEGKTIHKIQVRKNLIIPAPYFLHRGFPAHILDEFDVGMAKKPKFETQNRVIVPIYNEREYLVGYTCRSIFEKCPQCKLFHDVNQLCPTTNFERNLCSKWRHVGFSAEETLYGYNKAFHHIKNTNTVVLVEGPGDLWRLQENGIKNCVGLFGKNLYEKQEKLLAQAQCMTMIVLTDNDSAGQDGAKEIKEKFGRLYRMYFPRFSGHDVGDLNSDVITETIQPLIDASKNIYKEDLV